MKKNFSNKGSRERIDKIEKKASIPSPVKKEKSTKNRLSIYDDFEDEEDDLDPKSSKQFKFKK